MVILVAVKVAVGTAIYVLVYVALYVAIVAGSIAIVMVVGLVGKSLDVTPTANVTVVRPDVLGTTTECVKFAAIRPPYGNSAKFGVTDSGSKSLVSSLRHELNNNTVAAKPTVKILFKYLVFMFLKLIGFT